MTQDEIIEIAREAAAQITIQANGDVFYSFYGIELERFAQLVAAKEREACAKIVQAHLDANDDLRTKGSLASVLDYIKFRGEA
jgi:glutamine phosphoribosylpyrophosphate amidotransferase